MLVVPKLPESSQRKLDLEWETLIEAHSFNGTHLKWHESSTRRREAAKPCVRVKPTPIGESRGDTHSGDGRLDSYDERLKRQNDEWAARANAPEVIDSIGIFETITLGTTRFLRVVAEYRALWATTSDPRTKMFSAWLEELKGLVISECRSLWTGDWHSGWFTRACEGKLAEELNGLARQAVSRTRELELKHLEYPNLSLVSIVAADGNLDSASMLDSWEQTLRMGQEAIDRSRAALSPKTAVDEFKPAAPAFRETPLGFRPESAVTAVEIAMPALPGSPDQSTRRPQGTPEKALPELPELSESTKRKLKIQWDNVRDKHRLREEDISNYDRERQRLLWMPAPPPSHVRPLRPHSAALDVGLDPSVRAATARFHEIDWEYWLLWGSSGFEYEVYRDWLDSVTRQVSSEFASIWKCRSDVTDHWFQSTCAPAIKNALADLAKQRIAQARDVEVQRLKRAPSTADAAAGNPILDEMYAGGEHLSPAAQRVLAAAGLRREQSVPPAELKLGAPAPIPSGGAPSNSGHTSPTVEGGAVEGNSPETLAGESRKPNRALAAFPERGAWLSNEMKARNNLTPYGLHKAGGPDPKTVAKILRGASVREAQLEKVVNGLSHEGRRVSRIDVPDK